MVKGPTMVWWPYTYTLSIIVSPELGALHTNPSPLSSQESCGGRRHMASSTASFLAPNTFSTAGAGGRRDRARKPRTASVSMSQAPPPQQQQLDQQEQTSMPAGERRREEQQQQQPALAAAAISGEPRQLPRQPTAKSRNMSREYGGQWLSSCTRHVRIYAAYIDPVTHAFDQSQMDKLTLLLDPTNEFVWTKETCRKVYSHFQELVDHYEGAPLTEYTLRLIGSDLEHYIRKLLYDGEIKYNMNARVLNFSMGKPRVVFKSNATSPQGVNLP